MGDAVGGAGGGGGGGDGRGADAVVGGGGAGGGGGVGGGGGGGGRGGGSGALAKLTQHAQDIIRMTRETELLQSFLRVEAGEREAGAGGGRRRPARRTGDAAAPDVAPAAATPAPPNDPAPAAPSASAADRPRERAPRPASPGAKKALSFSQLKKEMRQQKTPGGGEGGEGAGGGGGGRRRRGKAKRKRQEVRQEEVYTDKDRAAAVAAGSRDIKQSLKQKRKEDRSRALQIPEEAEPGSLLALGARELKTGDVRVAIGFVHKALELNPRDKSALVARARCYLLLGEPQLALADAETALRPDKTFVKAIYQKAEALYHLGDFEHALVFYHRGLRLRPELEHFRLGVQKAQEAIENTIGGKTFPGLPAEHYLLPMPDRPNLAADTGPSVPPAPTAAAALPSPGSSAATAPAATGCSGVPPIRPASSATGSARTHSSASQSRRQARHLLGELCVDKDYLEQLLKHPDIKCANQEKADHIATHAQEGVAFLTNRQEFWRQQKSAAPSPGAKSAGAKRQRQRNGAH